jgi:1-pyrroline-5-carboxylate dehydrogenase
VYDDVLSKVAERTKRITMGDPSDPSNFMGAVIDSNAFRKIRDYIEVGKKEGLLVTGGDTKDAGGYFIPPTIVADVKPDSRLAQEEVFGPLLAFIRARDFDHAMEIANSTEYGLTGALFSKDEDRLNFAADDFHVGNLYLNRKCTGAMVGAQPFGGFNMSGTDSKAGGPDYLLLFTQGKSVTRKR